MTPDAQGERWCAYTDSGRMSNAVDGHFVHLGNRVEEREREACFVFGYRLHSGDYAGAPISIRVGDRGDVFDARDQSCKRFVALRARLPSVGDLVGRGPHLVGRELLQQGPAPVHDAEVRPEELVRGTEQEIDAEGLGVEEVMRREVNRVGY